MAYRSVFWELRHLAVDRLYSLGVDRNRLQECLLQPLGEALMMTLEAADDDLRDEVISAFLRASTAAFERALLDGGMTRSFTVKDADVLEQDLAALKDFFVAEGEGLDEDAVEAGCARAEQLVSLFGLDTELVCGSFEDACALLTDPARERASRTVAEDPDILLRVLAHRQDRAASKFLKARFPNMKKKE